MTKIHTERMIPQLDGDFVVFLIGLRINKPWKVHKWWPVMSAMPRMLKELDANPDLGCLGYITGFKVIVQYWRSFELLEAYAQSREHAHLPAWKAFNQSVGRSRGDVGIWHETYQIRAGEYEGDLQRHARFRARQRRDAACGIEENRFRRLTHARRRIKYLYMPTSSAREI